MFDIPMKTTPPLNLSAGAGGSLFGDSGAGGNVASGNAGNTGSFGGNAGNFGGNAGNFGGNAPVSNNSFGGNAGSTPAGGFTGGNGNGNGNTGFGTSAPVNNTPVNSNPVNSTPVNSTPAQHYEKKASGGVILKKGSKQKLGALANGSEPERLKVCLGWDTSGNAAYDLDSSCFMLGADGKVVGDDWFVFYNQPCSPDSAVIHTGDNKTGQGDGDDEIININLSRISPNVQKLVFVITINDAIDYGYNFGAVSNAFARIVDADSNRELAIFNLTEYYDNVTAMVVCELYKHNGEWKVNPVGNGLKQTGLVELCQFYGVNIAG